MGYFTDKEAKDIEYKKNGQENVEGALDDLYGKSSIIDGEVDYYNDLPLPIDHNGQTWLVEKYSILTPTKLTGLYYCNGVSWDRRSDKVIYSLESFSGVNKLVKTNDTNRQIIETEIEIDSSNNLDLKSGGLKDVNVINAIKLGDINNIELTTGNKTIIGGLNEISTRTSGINTGDETTSTIKTKLGTATTSTDGYLTSTDWNTFNTKQSALGYTAENTANKRTSFQATPTDTAYCSEKLVKDNLDLKANDNAVLKLSGDQTSTGIKTFQEIKFSGATKISSAIGSNIEINSGTTNILTTNGTTLQTVFEKQCVFKNIALTNQTLSISLGTASWNLNNGNMGTLTLTGDITLNNPTNQLVGSTLRLIVKQDATGSRLISTWGDNYKFPGGVKPVLTATANAIDILEFVIIDSDVVALTNFLSDVK